MKKQIIERFINCTCDEGYKSRELSDPSCAYCTHYEDIEGIMDLWHEYMENTNKVYKQNSV